MGYDPCGFALGKAWTRYPKEAEPVMDRPTFTLTLPSDLRMLTVARSFVEAVCDACALERALRHALVLATGEAVSNIVRHAHRDLPHAELTMHLQVSDSDIILTFLDEGAPFDIATVPQLPPGEVRIGGRGVYLLRALMDDVTCERRGEQGNILRLVKRRSDPSHPAATLAAARAI
jgi:serine/threonine-protein kinase RsbW